VYSERRERRPAAVSSWRCIMKKVGAVLLIALALVPLLAGSATADWRGARGGRGGSWHGGHGGWSAGGFFLGLGVGTLLTAPWWYPPAYAYPAYPPAYTYPVYSYPASPYPVYTPPAYTYAYPTYGPPSATTPTPEPLSPPPPVPPTSAQSCQTVTVEGHYETRVLANGQRVTAWIPAYTQQICQ
jgi:hypothetical protein